MAIRRGGPPKPLGTTSRAAPSGRATSGPRPSATPPADAFEDSRTEPREAADRTAPRPSAGETAAGRAEIQAKAEIGKLEKELAKLLELFAAADSEARLWGRLREHRKRLETARRRLNQLRRRRLELSVRWGEAALSPEVEALSQSLSRLSSVGERFEGIFAELSALFDAPNPDQGRGVSARRHRALAATDGPAAPPSALLAELALAMIELLSHEEGGA